MDYLHPEDIMQARVHGSDAASRAAFLASFQRLFWVTYRRGFPALPGTRLSSDTGWGCMIRTGQMALAHALQRQLLGDGWTECTETSDSIRRRIAYWLTDSPSPETMLSLHHLTAAGAARGTPIGQWFGPNDVCLSIRDCVNNASHLNGLLRVAVFNSGVLYTQTVHALCTPSTQPYAESTSVPSDSTVSTGSDHPAVAASSADAAGIDSVPDVALGPPLDEEGLEMTPTLQDGEDDEQVEPQLPDSVSGPSPSLPALPVCSEKSEKVHQMLDWTMDGDGTATGCGQATPAPSAGHHVEWQSAALIFLVVRLGLDCLNSNYCRPLLSLLSSPHCIGLLGGTPRHSVYCVGRRGEDVVYLDPHTTQGAWVPPTLVEDEKEEEEEGGGRSKRVTGLESPTMSLPDGYLDSFSCRQPAFAHVNRLDPSLAIAFHCRNRVEFDELTAFLHAILPSFGDWAPFSVVHGREPVYGGGGGGVEGGEEEEDEDGTVLLSHPFVYEEEGGGDDDDEFVLISSTHRPAIHCES